LTSQGRPAGQQEARNGWVVKFRTSANALATAKTRLRANMLNEFNHKMLLVPTPKEQWQKMQKK